MTTLTKPDAPAGMPGGPDRSEPTTSRWSRWRASWRVALRMARRDLRRHKGRSLLVFLMVAIPVGLLAGAATLGATEQTDAADLVTARMGSGQALVRGPEAGKIQQAPDPDQGGMGWGSDNPATPIPGFAPDARADDNAAAIGGLVGGTAVPVVEAEMRLVKGDRRIRVSALVLDVRATDVGAKAHLTHGSWGADSDEIAITPAGERKGLPRSGEVTLSSGGTERTVRVVGTASALLEWGGQPDFVVPTLPEDAGINASGIGGAESWIITGQDAVSWEEVKKLNTYGLTAYSRSVLENPPPKSELPPELRQQQSFTQDTGRMIAIIGGVMLFIITTLLVGPAFAVSASRQRRTLALAATNGAEVRQLRRTVLAQALVLGVISAVGGVLLGIAGVRGGLWWWVRTHPSTHYASVPLDIPWAAIAILLPCAVLSALVAALLPSLRLGRLDIIGVMRGQSVSPKLNRVLPFVGLVLAVLGGLVVLSSAKVLSGGEVKIALGAIGLVLGTLFVIPALLVLFGRLASRLPVAPRMATRDASRHRSRSTPTVAAILAGVAALTAFSIGLASDTEQRMATYQPQALPGEGVVHTGDAETRIAVDSAMAASGSGLVRTPFMAVRPAEDPMMGPPPPGTEAKPLPFVTAVPRGCTPAKAIFVASGPGDLDCVRLGTQAYDRGQIGALPAAEIARRLGLTDAQRKVIEQGGIAVAVNGLVDQTTVTMASGTFVMDQQTYTPTQVTQARSAELPVVPVPGPSRSNGAVPGPSTGALVATETAKRLGWPLQQESVLLRDPNGAISAATEKQLDERVGQEGGLYVERGFQRDDRAAMRIMMGAGAALILIVTLISTALSMAEQQADLGTLAAVGATRGTRRRFAAGQSMVVGLMGAVLGIAVGLVPGIAVTYPLTTDGGFDPSTGTNAELGPYLAIPWQPLLLVVVGVPILAGLLSAAAIRKAPMMTRRAD
jgi:putative ABC transport system permease protein